MFNHHKIKVGTMGDNGTNRQKLKDCLLIYLNQNKLINTIIFPVKAMSN